MWGYILMIIGVIGLDQWSKWWVTEQIEIGQTVSLHNPIFSLTHLHNNGAAWSILEGQMWFFIIITIVAVSVAVYYLYQYRQQFSWLTIGISFCLGGALGNFIDRIRLGYVVDMLQLEFIDFPIFNIADSALSIGVGCLLIYFILD